MRIRGLVKGTPFSVATLRSVILSSDGFDALFTFCVAASTSSALLKKLARLIPAAAVVVDLKKDRRSRTCLRDSFLDITNPSAGFACQQPESHAVRGWKIEKTGILAPF